MSETYDLFQRGREHLQKGRAAQATVSLEKAKRREPDKASIREALGIAYFRSQRYEEAESEFRAMVDISPADDYAHYGLARALEKLGRKDEARGHMKLASSLRPGSEDYAERARALEQLRAVVQRVAEARVVVGNDVVGEIGPGLCVLLGVARDDDEAAAQRLAETVARLRIFENEEGKFDRSVLDTAGAALVVSQFTLIADTAKGNRPSFSAAAAPPEGERLYELFCAALTGLGVSVETGVFGARMQLRLTNDGPVTIVLDGVDAIMPS